MKQGVNAVILNDKEEVLLLRRADGKFKGCLTMPGGKVEPRETLAQAMVREVKEETNLNVINYQFISKFYFSKIDVEIGLFFAKTNGKIKLDLRESSEYFYLKPTKDNVEKYFNDKKIEHNDNLYFILRNDDDIVYKFKLLKFILS